MLAISKKMETFYFLEIDSWKLKMSITGTFGQAKAIIK
jgi:hypothetical protein